MYDTMYVRPLHLVRKKIKKLVIKDTLFRMT